MEWILQLGKKPRRRILPIRRATVWVGRDESCAIRISSSKVSRLHCALVVQEGELYLHDEGSRNGTFVNGQRLTGMQALHPGDRIRIGSVSFTVAVRREPGGTLEDVAADMLLAAENND